MPFKPIIILLSCLLATLLLMGCESKAPGEAQSEHAAVPVDSFDIEKLASHLEISDLHWMGDGRILGFNGFSKLCYYSREGKTFSLSDSLSLPASSGTPRFIYPDETASCFYIFEGQSIYRYDSALAKTGSWRLKTTMPYLGSDYMLTFSNMAPPLKLGNAFIVNYCHNMVDKILLGYREQLKMRLSLGKDSVIEVSRFFDKPSGLKYYDGDFSYAHAFAGNRVYQLFSGLDTLYIYDLATNAQSKRPIHNRDYTVPQKKEVEEYIREPQTMTKHYIGNFYYNSIYYNTSTRHFVLFYTLPKQAEDGKNPTEKWIKALVLDEALQPLEYLNMKPQSVPDASFPIEGKGLAVPMFHSDLTHEKTTFYIYSF